MSTNPFFPASYTPWLAKRLPGSLPETQATCNTCAMVKPTGLTRDKGPFLNNLKCCTYFPYVPNFSLGAIDENKILKALPRGILLPVGLFPTAEHQDLVAELGIKAFGQKSELLCPFFDTAQNQCSTWDTRPGVCTTYFCKSDYGKKGLDFWADVEKYLNHFEWQMACHVIRELGMGENEIAYCQGVISPETEDDEREYFLQAAWGKWFSKKYEFYKEASRVASTVSVDQVAGLIGDEFLELEKKIRNDSLGMR